MLKRMNVYGVEFIFHFVDTIMMNSTDVAVKSVDGSQSSRELEDLQETRE